MQAQWVPCALCLVRKTCQIISSIGLKHWRLLVPVTLTLQWWNGKCSVPLSRPVAECGKQFVYEFSYSRNNDEYINVFVIYYIHFVWFDLTQKYCSVQIDRHRLGERRGYAKRLRSRLPNNLVRRWRFSGQVVSTHSSLCTICEDVR